jgi:hypothetical protein
VKDAGYTAVEALAALAILGLAVSGLTGGLKVIGLSERATSVKVSQTLAIRTASGELAMLVAGQGPFRSDSPEAFAGDGRSFSFPCDGGSCGAQLSDTGMSISRPTGSPRGVLLSGADHLRFSYLGSQSQVSAWPPAPPPRPAPQWQVLRTVLVQDAVNGDVVLVTPIATQQAADCQYDGILQDCRKAGS